MGSRPHRSRSEEGADFFYDCQICYPGLESLIFAEIVLH